MEAEGEAAAILAKAEATAAALQRVADATMVPGGSNAAALSCNSNITAIGWTTPACAGPALGATLRGRQTVQLESGERILTGGGEVLAVACVGVLQGILA